MWSTRRCPLARVLRSTEGAGLRVVILDACRNNPLAQTMERTDLTRSISRGSFAALDERRLGNDTLVAYAAEAGKTVPDGRGRNSPYTTALLEYVEEPLELLTMFRRVRNRVLEETNEGQRPWEYQSLRSDHYLAGESDVATTVDDPPTVVSARRWRDGEVFRDCPTCPEMVVQPGGRLALGQYEVTREEYGAFAVATERTSGGGCRVLRLEPNDMRRE